MRRRIMAVGGINMSDVRGSIVISWCASVLAEIGLVVGSILVLDGAIGVLVGVFPITFGRVVLGGLGVLLGCLLVVDGPIHVELFVVGLPAMVGTTGIEIGPRSGGCGMGSIVARCLVFARGGVLAFFLLVVLSLFLLIGCSLQV